MKCSRCYKSIPSGEEIQKSSLFWFWGSETCCKKCAVVRDKQKVWYWVFVIGLCLLGFLIPIIFALWKVWRK